jgi:hypothetical protein
VDWGHPSSRSAGVVSLGHGCLRHRLAALDDTREGELRGLRRMNQIAPNDHSGVRSMTRSGSAEGSVVGCQSAMGFVADHVRSGSPNLMGA